MKKINVNNDRIVEIEGNKVIYRNSKGEIDRELIISDCDIIMLLNYYINCKNGIEESDYILKD